jgi:hypothetical protein
MKKALAIAVAVSIIGCATPPPKTYTSAAIYQPLDCYQLATEAMRIEQAAAAQQASKGNKEAANIAAVAVGMLLLWPALFFIQGTGAEDAEINRLSADQDALVMAATMKKCPLQTKRIEPPPPAVPVTDRKPGEAMR